jgi:tetratricopeptide (TPR) repeat protein
MKRASAIVFASATLLAVCVTFTASPAAAEPIPAGESVLAMPDNAAQSAQASGALARFNEKDYDGALRAWKEVALQNPDVPPAQAIMAQLYLRKRMLKEAKIAVDKAIADDPGDPEGYILAGVIAAGEGDMVKAETSYQKAESLLAAFSKSAKRKASMRPRIFSGMAGLSEARKDWAGAQAIYEEWLKAEPNNAEVMQRIGYCLLLRKNIDGALVTFRQAAEASPDMLPAEAVVAQFYRGSGDRANAEKWLAKALAVAPKDLKTRLLAGTWALEGGQMEEAQKHVRVAMQLAPKALEVKLLRGSVALFQKEYDVAELVCASALEQSPRSFLASNNLAMALIEQKPEAKQNRALELSEANAKKFPKSPIAASTYGWVLYKLGRLEDADKALSAATFDETADVDTAYIIARVAADRGHKAEAKKTLENGLKSTGPAMFRDEAESLLAELKK